MNEYRPPYGHAALATGAVLLLYVVTLGPTTWFWDTSEYIATAHIVGIPHPPGNPLFVVLGRVWSLLLEPTGLPVAVRINLMAAVTSSLATGFLFLALHRVLGGWVRGGAGTASSGAGKKGAERDRKAESRAARRRKARSGGRSSDGDEEAAEGGGSPRGSAAEVEGPWARRLPLIGAWAGAVLAATAFTVWNQSNVNEKVYTLSVLGIAAVTWLALRWNDRKDEPGAGWLLVLAIYIMVLGSTNHLMALLPAPALALLVLLEKPGVLLDRRILVRGAAAVILGLSFNFFLPIRSAQQPIINEGEPVCETVTGAATAIYSLGRVGCPALAANLTREQYAKPSTFVDPTSDPRSPSPRSASLLAHQFHNYFQYFDWQWSRGLAASPVPSGARLPFTLVFLGLGIWGLVVSGRSHRGHLVYLGTLAVTLTLGLVYYLNFRYGYSLAPEHIPREMREVRERDYFFIASFHLWGGLAGMGLVGAWRWASGGGAEARNLALASPVLALAFVPLLLNWGWADRTGDYSARDWGYNLLQSVEPYGILFTNGDNDTFPLWYLQEVEEIRQDVTVIVVQYLYTQWYPRQVRYHTSPERQRPFRADERIRELYGEAPRRPTRSVTTLTDDQLSRMSYVRLDQDYTVPLGQVAVQYPAGFELGRGDQIALAIIRDSLGERPIHFASTAGLAQDLGLGRWAVRQGLASRLRVEDLDEVPGVMRVSENLGGEWIDLDRSLALAREVYDFRGLVDRNIWADRSTLNIPWHFYFLYLQMADAASRTDRSDALVEELLAWSDRFLVTARGGIRGSP